MFRFSIRDVLWLTVVVALGAGWWVEYRKVTPEDREILKIAKEKFGFRLEKTPFGGHPPSPNAVSHP